MASAGTTHEAAHADAGRRADAATRLRVVGLAATLPRRWVLGMLDGHAQPVSAGDIHCALRAIGLRIALTTVYRALRSLADRGLVHVFPGDEQRYRTCADSPHSHLVCRSCGLVIEEPADTARRLVSANVDFEVDVQHTPVYGVCGPCRRTATGSS